MRRAAPMGADSGRLGGETDAGARTCAAILREGGGGGRGGSFVREERDGEVAIAIGDARERERRRANPTRTQGTRMQNLWIATNI